MLLNPYREAWKTACTASRGDAGWALPDTTAGQQHCVLDRNLTLAHNVLIRQAWPASKRFRGTPSRGMTELFRHPLSQAALWFAVIFALFALVVAILRRWRGDSYDAQPDASELLTKFRELHARGGLSDDEYRTIKTKLAGQLDGQLKDNNETS